MTIKYSSVRAGCQLIADGGFTCLEAGTIVTVAEDDGGRLYVSCADGHHYLSGQLDFRGQENLVGFTQLAGDD